MVHAEYALERPSNGRLLRRGLACRCPWCGSRGLFTRWIRMVERCPRCDLRFERVQGQWIGAIAVNTVLSLGALLAVIVVGTALTLPDVPFAPLAAAALLVGGITPVLVQPLSRTLWTAIDLAVRPLEPDELS